MIDFVKNHKKIFNLLLFWVFVFTIFSQSLTFDELISRTKATLQWDPYSQMGLLEKGGKTISFSVGDPWMVCNYRDKISTGTVLKEKGILIFSEEASMSILKFFGEEVNEKDLFKVGVILIDPGHGGKDPGTISTIDVNGVSVLVQEKNIVLDVSLRLADMLREKYPDKKIMLTRDDDSYPTLDDRVVLANNIEVSPKEGIVFIAVHVNASPNPNAEGYEVWYLPKEYRRQIVNQNEYDGDDSVLPVLNSILEEQYTMESVRLAESILNNFTQELPSGVPNRGLKEESWFVVRNAKMAAVLVELGFVTNKDEAHRMIQTNYLKKLTNGLYNGVNNFIDYFEEKGFSR
ncbi:MAG: N-acetylmuramoyl-L-alanine amidase [Spirochaetaceae bacterium]|nr:N-acetylmuramoyl-L-alanine amidase [Spirochaetaceae bacterium]